MQTHLIHSASEPDDLVTSIVAILRSRYGSDARQVAERQVVEAEASSRATWEAILSRLAT